MAQKTEFAHLPGGGKLRAWRKRVNLTQDEVGRQLGVQVSVISDLELGRRKLHSAEKCLLLETISKGAVKAEDWVDQ